LNFLEIEKLRSELSSFLPQINGLPKVLVLFSFYEKLLHCNDANLIDAFAVEFIDEYLAKLDFYSPFYSEPTRTEQLLKQLSEMKLIPVLENKQSRLEDLISSINKKLNNFLAVLEGNIGQPEKREKLLFPLLGKVVTSSETYTYASIEPVTIKVTTAKHKDSFVFIPSHQKKEQLEEQTKISFQLALRYLKDYKHKFHKYHEVLIYFENLSADYEGYSLGIALTIGFIEQLSLLYNLPYLTIVKNNIASTGGLDQNGNVSALGEEIIKQKVEAAFYSDLETLIIPEADELAAKEKLNELNEKYPKRGLRLTAVENLADILNRRNLMEIKKQSPVVRTAKNIKKNWVAVSLSLIIFLIIGFFWIREFDDNPYTFEQTVNEIIIKNKTNRNLWNISYPDELIKLQGNEAIESVFRILDVNNNGINEVLFEFSRNGKYSDESISQGLVLLNNKGEILWRCTFRKNLTSNREFLTPPYGINIYDTLRINNELSILCGSSNSNSYPSAAYILNLKSNKVVSDTLWNPGHISDVRVVDLNNDKKKELIVLAYNNGLQKISLYHLDIDELKGQVPTTDEYRLHNIRDAKILNYFLFPNSDYNQYLGYRTTSTRMRGLFFDYESKMVRFVSSEAGLQKQGHIIYNWYYEKNDFDVAIGSDLRVFRDSLVAHGKLPLPYTDTKEYRELLRSQIQTWDGKKFVKREESE